MLFPIVCAVCCQLAVCTRLVPTNSTNRQWTLASSSSLHRWPIINTSDNNIRYRPVDKDNSSNMINEANVPLPSNPRSASTSDHYRISVHTSDVSRKLGSVAVSSHLPPLPSPPLRVPRSEQTDLSYSNLDGSPENYDHLMPSQWHKYISSISVPREPQFDGYNELIPQRSTQVTQGLFHPSSSVLSPFSAIKPSPSTVATNKSFVNPFSPETWPMSSGQLIFRLIGALFCIFIILLTIVGNVLVIIVVTRFHRMRTVTNILLASLAIADITVACFVMPFTVVYDVFRYWPWGSILCHFWISCDVMCCTASILHLCCVAIDRFWAITRPLRYRTYISKRRLFCCIILIWFCSAAISFIPIFSGWYHSEGPINVFTLQDLEECGLDVNRVYAIISSLTSFYLPLPIMFYVYFRILLVAERQSREIKQLEQSLQQNGLLSVNYTPASPVPNRPNGQSMIHFSSLINVETGESGHLNGSNSMDGVSIGGSSDNSTLENKRHAERSLRRRTRQLITDTKAIRTLGIVMGVFCLCWLPFFIMYVISAYCTNCNISYEIRSSITWLGYINSALNPAIYAYMNKEFKTAFKRVICCMPRMQMENERDTMMDEVSTTSRSYQRNIDRIHGGLDVPPTPGFMSRTPSATPDTTNWPIIHGHNLVLSSERSQSKPSICITTESESKAQSKTSQKNVNGKIKLSIKNMTKNGL